MPMYPVSSFPKTAYNTAGATLSEKNACGQYGLTLDQLREGVEAGKLKVQRRSCHGNGYRLYFTDEIRAFAKEQQGPEYEISEAKKSLRSILVEIKELDSKQASLQSQKLLLEKMIVSLGGSLADPPAKKRKTNVKKCEDDSDYRIHS